MENDCNAQSNPLNKLSSLFSQTLPGPSRPSFITHPSLEQEFIQLPERHLELQERRTPHLPELQSRPSPWQQGFDRAWEPSLRHDWAREFQGHAGPSREHPLALQEAFDRAQNIPPSSSSSWAREFADSSNQNEWRLEFEQEQAWAKEFAQAQSLSVHGSDSKEVMAKTAAMLIDAVDHHPKLRDSKFLDFMKQLRDKKVAVENDKLVQQISPVQSASDWAKEFGQSMPMVRPGNWEEEFHLGQHHSVPNALPWTSEFGKMSLQPMLDPVAESWKKEFLQAESMQIQESTEDQVTQDMERAFHDFYGKNHQEWRQEFEKDLAQMKNAQAQDPQLNQMAQEWEKAHAGHADLDQSDFSGHQRYAFSPNNPYLNTPFILNENASVSERILRLEAHVQKNQEDAQAWHRLGLAQQENENDANAIAALRQAVTLDPNHLETWMLLAASLTNENRSDEACEALESWLQHHPKYRQYQAQGPVATSLSERQLTLRKSYLQAVRQETALELDPDVQVGLGILLTMTSEYDKAVDCFEAALSKRPQDYILWNKLGYLFLCDHLKRSATFANSNDSSKAVNAYFNALEINPSYIRARCNLAIACIQLSQYREAAEHLLSALVIQSNHVLPGASARPGVQSATVWATLKMVVDGYSMWSLINSLYSLNK